jgi:IPTL-CTERM motif
MNLKAKVLIGLFTALVVPAAFAQISDVQPGADDQGSGCGASGTTLAGQGNPAPSYQLSKPCATAQPAFAFADIISTLENGTTPVSALTSAGFDIKNGTHCGGGAPRFEIDLDNHTHFVITLSCTQGTMTDLGNGWTRVTFSSAQIAAGVTAAGGTPSSIITDLFILMDEGTDTPTSVLVGTPGTAIIDNVMVNGATFGGVSAAASVPTLNEWVMITLAGILALAGVFLLRR